MAGGKDETYDYLFKGEFHFVLSAECWLVSATRIAWS